MTQTKALVSIVLPTLNAARHLRQSLDSCLHQTYPRFEIIVVDGGSTDETLDILSGYVDPRLVILHQASNSGRLPGALNLGFARSTGDYLTWTQADDFYESNAIELMVQYLEQRPTVDFVYCDYWWVDDLGRRLRTSEVCPSDLLRRQNAVGQCFLYRRSVYEDVGEYDPAFYMSEDYEYWLRIWLRHRMELYPELLYSHRWWSHSLTVKDYGRYEALRVSAKARQKWLGVSWNEYRRDIAFAYIEEAFARHADGDVKGGRLSLLQGLSRNPLWLTNRGVRSLLARAVIGRITDRLPTSIAR